MGLHSEMRGYFRNTFPDSVLQHLPSCDVQIVDFMWLLYRFYTPHSACHPREFIAFASCGGGCVGGGEGGLGAGKKIYDPRFKETTSIAILCELMDIAAEKRKDESDTYKKSIKDSLVRLCESHARGGFKKIFAKAKKTLMTMQPELIYHELNKTLGFARFCKKSHNTPVTSTWKEVLLQLKKVYKKSHKEATAPIMTLVNKPIFYAGKQTRNDSLQREDMFSFFASIRLR